MYLIRCGRTRCQAGAGCLYGGLGRERAEESPLFQEVFLDAPPATSALAFLRSSQLSIPTPSCPVHLYASGIFPTGSVAQTVLSAATAQEQLHQSFLSEQMGEGQLGVGKPPWFSQSQPSSPEMLLGEDFLLPRNPCPSFPAQKPPASLRRKQGHNRPSSELGRSCVKTPKREPRVSTQPANSL